MEGFNEFNEFHYSFFPLFTETSRPRPMEALRRVKLHRSRRKRSLDEAFIETMVTADKTLSDSFKSKADLQSYIITIMGMVSIVCELHRDS